MNVEPKGKRLDMHRIIDKLAATNGKTQIETIRKGIEND